MKYLIIIILTLLTTMLSSQNVATRIDNVTVYRNGAYVNRVGIMNVKKGTETYYLNDISSDMVESSLRLAVKNEQVRVVRFARKGETVVVDKEYAKEKEKAESRMAALEDTMSLSRMKKGVLEDEKRLILANNKVSGRNQGLTSESLSQMAAYYKQRLTSIEQAMAKLNWTISKCQDEKNRLQQAISNRSIGVEKSASRVELVLQSPSDINGVPVEVGYLVNKASWAPAYDVRVTEVDKPLAVGYYASVSQNTNETWDNVHLTLSTGDPTVDNTCPEFEKTYFPSQGNRKTGVKTRKGTKLHSNVATGVVVDAEGIPIVGANVIESERHTGVVADLEGRFSITLSNMNSKLEFSFVGYRSQLVEAGNNMYVVLEDEEFEEVIVVGYGVTRSDSYVEPEPTPKVKKDIPMNIEQTITSTEFVIKSPYTIASDNKDHNVKLLNYNLDAEYKLSCAPRFSNDVYLVSSVAECSKYALQSGMANLYLNNSYQGKTFVEPNVATDTLTISVGRDRSIALSREEIRSNKSKSVFGGTVTEQKCFEITVKNNKSTVADLEIEDQMPVSQRSDIKVTLTESANAIVEKETGKLTWKVKLAPKEQRKIRFSYEVKYPKRERVIVY